MFTTDPEVLKKLTAPNRLWQGIPGIAVTEKGKQFVTFYSGGTRESIGNYVVLITGTDQTPFGEPIAAAVPDKNHRCYDPTVWIDPLGRLWLIWACFPDERVCAVICEHPDDENLVFGEEFTIGKDVMMNNPIVLSTGEWLFPIAVWQKNVSVLPRTDVKESECGSAAYVSADQGKTFERRGAAIIPESSFDEHQFLELRDNSIAVFTRTFYGIGTARSYDGGYTWTKGHPGGIPGPSSRFYIGRMPSGKVLMVNHYNFTGRNNLTALISEDDGKTWSHKLLLDERSEVSYPSVSFSGDAIYIAYDFNRGSFKKTLAEALACEREILTAKITEADIMSGRLVTKGSYLKRVVSKLGDYHGECANPFEEIDRFTAAELAAYLLDRYDINEIPEKVFEFNPIYCGQAHTVDHRKLDRLFDEFFQSPENRVTILTRIISSVRVNKNDAVTDTVIAPVIAYIENNLNKPLDLEVLSSTFNISKYYLSHLFKHETGLSIIKFCNERKIYRAKKLLISHLPISEIAYQCGYDSVSYFSKKFKEETGLTPAQYRAALQPPKRKAP